MSQNISQSQDMKIDQNIDILKNSKKDQNSNKDQNGQGSQKDKNSHNNSKKKALSLPAFIKRQTINSQKNIILIIFTCINWKYQSMSRTYPRQKVLMSIL